MKMKKTVAALGTILALSGATMTYADSYIVMANGNGVSNKILQSLENAGATVTLTIPQVGLIVVESNDPDFRSIAGNIKGVNTAFADMSLRYIEPDLAVQDVITLDAASPPNTGDDDFFFDLQWGHTAIGATDAWATGQRGSGVRVAVIDTGIDPNHPDLAPNLNVALSASFIPGETFDIPAGSHGTHVSGTIGAADNAFGTIGVAPEVELVSIKGLSAVTGSGPFSSIFASMVYAADIDADVINMSLGADIPHNCTFDNGDGTSTHFPAKDCAALFTALNRVTHYVEKSGAVVIAAAGNDGRDMNGDASLKSFPAEGNHVISVSSTAPFNWGRDANADLDELSSFSNYGSSGIDVAGPGGDFDLFFADGGAPCNGPVLPGRPCYVYDMVFSTAPGGWSWNAGTSMASPHVAGVAALIIGANGGNMKPNKVRNALTHSSDDLGQPGKDDIYGHGRVNAYKAVQ